MLAVTGCHSALEVVRIDEGRVQITGKGGAMADVPKIPQAQATGNWYCLADGMRDAVALDCMKGARVLCREAVPAP
jgi:hypothetical protein